MWWPDRCCSGWLWSRPFRTVCPTTTGSTTHNSYTPRLWIRMRVSSSLFVSKPDGPRISQIQQPHLPGATENDDQPHRPHRPQLDPRVSFVLFWRLRWFHAQKVLYALCAGRLHRHIVCSSHCGIHVQTLTCTASIMPPQSNIDMRGENACRKWDINIVANYCRANCQTETREE